MLIRPYGFGEIAPLAAPSHQKEVAHGNWLPGSAVHIRFDGLQFLCAGRLLEQLL